MSGYTSIARHIEDRIEDGTYPPGSKLPTGEQLADQFAVTRQSVNNSFRSLVTTGAIRMERGKGAFVADPPEVVPAELLVDYVLDRVRGGDRLLFLDTAGNYERVVVSAPEEE